MCPALSVLCPTAAAGRQGVLERGREGGSTPRTKFPSNFAFPKIFSEAAGGCWFEGG